MDEHESNIWRDGYDCGTKHALKENDIALQIGRAILGALDGRYEFKEETY